jgi:dTDP-4-dehydrorhamnose 3,5-epimerase-like enzyme
VHGCIRRYLVVDAVTVYRFTSEYRPEVEDERAGWYVQVIGYEWNTSNDWDANPLMFLVRFMDGAEQLVFPEEVSVKA